MDAVQPDLFDPPALLPGLRFAPGFVAPDEESRLCRRIDAAGLSPFRFQGWQGKRLTASFGHSYDYARGRLTAAAPMPEWLLPLRARAAAFAGIEPQSLQQALLIRYDPGAQIGWHRDRPQFGTVVGISLGNAAVLRLCRREGQGFARRALPLPPRSLYLLADESRHQWEHSIAAQQQTRWSVTFRTLARH